MSLEPRGTGKIVPANDEFAKQQVLLGRTPDTNKPASVVTGGSKGGERRMKKGG